MKQEIHPYDCANALCKALTKGVLLTTKQGDFVNTMTIGWGAIGRDWSKPVFIAYVRESRHTRTILDETEEFTVNIPLQDPDPEIIRICGTKSGRELDKIQALGLHLEEPVSIGVPGIRELPMTLECRVIYRQEQDLNAIPAELVDRFYPAEEDTLHPGKDRDIHVCYYGEILSAYIIQQ